MGAKIATEAVSAAALIVIPAWAIPRPRSRCRRGLRVLGG